MDCFDKCTVWSVQVKSLLLDLIIYTLAVVEISVGCWRKPTGFHKKADRPIVKNGEKADRLLHKFVNIC